MNDTSPPVALAPLAFTCSKCSTSFPSRKLLLQHLRSDNDDPHKTCRFGAAESHSYPTLLAHGVLACHRGCGALFDGGSDATSKPYDAHLARGNCRHRRPKAPPPELVGPYSATSISGVRATLTAQAAVARSAPNAAPSHSTAVELCCVNRGFTPVHLRTSSIQSATSPPHPCQQQLV